MSYPRFAAGYTFRADVTFTADYDGGGPQNVTFLAREHYDTIDDLHTEMEDRIDTATGSTISIYCITAAGADQGKTYMDVGAGHTIAITWGAGTENVRLRNFLGYAGNLAAAQTHLSPAAHTGRWFPDDEGAIQDIQQGASASYGSGRTDSFVTSYFTPQQWDGTLTLRALAMTAGDFRQVQDLLVFANAVADGETFGIYADRTVLGAYTLARLSASWDSLTFNMDSPPDDRRWVASFPIQVIP